MCIYSAQKKKKKKKKKQRRVPRSHPFITSRILKTGQNKTQCTLLSRTYLDGDRHIYPRPLRDDLPGWQVQRARLHHALCTLVDLTEAPHDSAHPHRATAAQGRRIAVGRARLSTSMVVVSRHLVKYGSVAGCAVARWVSRSRSVMRYESPCQWSTNTAVSRKYHHSGFNLPD